MELVVRDRTTLVELRQPGMKARIRRIKLEGPIADPTMERALNRAYFACGCEEGSVAVLMTLLTSLLLGVIGGFEGALAWWCIAIYLAVSALLGKAIGLMLSSLRLRRIWRSLFDIAVETP